MTEYSQFAALPILVGPYSRRRLAGLRAPVLQMAMIAAALVTTAALFALGF